MDSFNCYSIVDERSAAFVGMGMAMSEKTCCGYLHKWFSSSKLLSCDHGSFLSNIPLLILTADRPTDFVIFSMDRRSVRIIFSSAFLRRFSAFGR
jgi:2-succinyl-5-enolpyruvyl-6-hydroxy-3-cyclohexene-1-carboxylate synthase